MEREIIFRGKRIDNGEWIEGNLLVMGDDYWIVPNYKNASTRSTIEIIAQTIVRVEKETVGQYTGKDDCNGKPMFEGDIVKTNLGHIQTIERSDDYCAFVCIEKGYDKPCQVDILDEIIKNRWDDPGLSEVQ